MIKKVGLLFRTIRFLKLVQFRFRAFYFLRNKMGTSYVPLQSREYNPIDISEWNDKQTDLEETPNQVLNVFSFLNIKHKFDGAVDWNYAGYGKLWTYNLNYFEYLQSSSKEIGTKLLHDFILRYNESKDGREPYPTSLRIVNTVKFLEKHVIKDPRINDLIYSDGCNLFKNLEYHLLGNHLLENGYGLLFAGIYCQNKKWMDKSYEIIHQELNEEYHTDGAHFEQSPMYHSILLERGLDALKLIRQQNHSIPIENLIKTTCINGLSYADFIQVNDQFPLFNDASYGIAKSLSYLRHYGTELGLVWPVLKQGKSSGYRRFDHVDFSLFLDVGPVGPDYQPGHAHADTFSFCLFDKGLPVLVDSGTSTYEIGAIRSNERSTTSHNTIAYDGQNSSEIWGGFRVANRAKTKIIKESDYGIEATHDGYSKFGVTHKRVLFQNSNGFVIEDFMEGEVDKESIYSLHFHPDCNVELEQNQITINSNLRVTCNDITDLRKEAYDYACGFNKRIKAVRITGIIKEKGFTHINRV